ncbi:hypothetical protein C2869_10885 [Saccharobesus litoralis]|uniref:Uncharacterized protein n=1 Tax=Saccharobesus litoralis TaxID=2172099 RepID=A0A2S0VRS0_9ALTE|nr:hypothetical protein [Saccharobesus litoralis]AWB66908.1 hypothetical protein C2869_10885 [Saccharobesus litoralis]
MNVVELNPTQQELPSTSHAACSRQLLLDMMLESSRDCVISREATLNAITVLFEAIANENPDVIKLLNTNGFDEFSLAMVQGYIARRKTEQ